ncbi:MAG TPA: hypothetical protein VHE37_15820, partial [Nevskiaceae bacterium]|nr:hypothetical protein [Nevskiaceae bacterium]
MNLRACLRLAALLAAALSSACANTAVHRPVADDMRSKIQNSEEVIGIKQDALYATYIPSMMSAASARTCSVIPGLGGLLAGACAAAMEGPDAVINASRAKDAAAAVAPLKDALADYSFDAQLRAELASSLSRNSAVHPVPEAISVTRQVSDADYEKTLRACHASALMFTTVDYHLSPDFSTLTVSSQSLIYPCSAKLRAAAGQPDLAALPADFQPLDVANAIYRNMIAYEARLPDASTASADNIARWHSGDAALLKAVLNQAAHELATQ